jgi:hypothetical protein
MSAGASDSKSCYPPRTAVNYGGVEGVEEYSSFPLNTPPPLPSVIHGLMFSTVLSFVFLLSVISVITQMMRGGHGFPF